MFKDRADAARRLSSLLEKYRKEHCVVLAIPRGGVIIADRICDDLGAEIGLVITRKIGAPSNEEAAIGAVAEDGTVVLDEEVIVDYSIPQRYIEKERARQIKEIKRRTRKYMADRLSPDIGKKTVIIVDDGIATGLTTLCAIRYVRNKKPKRIIVATPLAPSEVVEKLRQEADDVVVAASPTPFYAIGHFYQDFEQVSDGEVISVLKKYINR